MKVYFGSACYEYRLAKAASNIHRYPSLETADFDAAMCLDRPSFTPSGAMELSPLIETAIAVEAKLD